MTRAFVRFLGLTTAIFSLAIPVAQAEDLGSDVGFKIGGSVGTVSIADDKGTKIFSFGGMPFGMAWYKDLSAKWAGTLQAMAMFDLRNTQLIRQGVEGGVAFHLLGGPRRMGQEGHEAGFVSRSPMALSLALRGGVQHYAATDKEHTSERVSGSAFEAKSGLEYRREMTAESAITIDLLATIFSIPASVERLTPRTVELVFGWRTYL